MRVDSGVYDGWEVPFYYDPLIAKLIAFGADRPEAIERMKRALREYEIRGIKTNLNFFEQILSDPEFEAGRLSTHFIEESRGASRRPPTIRPKFPTPQCWQRRSRTEIIQPPRRPTSSRAGTPLENEFQARWPCFWQQVAGFPLTHPWSPTVAG